MLDSDPFALVGPVGVWDLRQSRGFATIPKNQGNFEVVNLTFRLIRLG
jgi:hypothetical protein